MKIAVLDSCPLETHSLYRLTQEAVDDALVLPYARVKSLVHAMHLQRFELAVIDAHMCGTPVLDALIRDLRREGPDTRIIVYQPTEPEPAIRAAASGADAVLSLAHGVAAAHATVLRCLIEPAPAPA